MHGGCFISQLNFFGSMLTVFPLFSLRRFLWLRRFDTDDVLVYKISIPES